MSLYRFFAALPTNADLPAVIQRMNSALGRATVRTVTAATTLNASDYAVRVDTTGGALTITLPLASTVIGQEFRITKITTDANAVTVSRQGSDTINGATSQTIAGGSRGVLRLLGVTSSSFDVV